MELVAMLAILFLIAITLSIKESRFTRALFSIAIVYFGLQVFLQGISYGSTAITVVGSLENYVVFIFMTIGSLLTAYSSLISDAPQ